MFNLDPDSPVRLTNRAARRFSGSAQFTNQMSRESVNQSRAPSMSPGNVSERPGWFVKITDGPELSSGSPVKGLFQGLMQSLTYDPGAISVATAITWADTPDVIKVWVAPRPGQTLAVDQEGFAEAVADLDGVPIMAIIAATATSPPPPPPVPTGIYILIGSQPSTGSTHYAFTQCAPPATGATTAVTGGATGDGTANWVQDVGGTFNDPGIVGAYAWAYPNPLPGMTGNYIMGPWIKKVTYPVVRLEAVCDDDGTLTVTEVLSTTPVIEYRIGK